MTDMCTPDLSISAVHAGFVECGFAFGRVSAASLKDGSSWNGQPFCAVGSSAAAKRGDRGTDERHPRRSSSLTANGSKHEYKRPGNKTAGAGMATENSRTGCVTGRHAAGHSLGPASGDEHIKTVVVEKTRERDFTSANGELQRCQSYAWKGKLASGDWGFRGSMGEIAWSQRGSGNSKNRRMTIQRMLRASYFFREAEK